MKILQRAKNSNGLVSNSFFIFLIRFFPSLATLLVLIFFSRHLSQQEYGSYQNFWVQLYLLGALATLGIPAFVLTYNPAFIKYLFRKLSTGSFIMIALWIVLISAAFGILRYVESNMEWYISTGIFLVYVFNAISESILIVCKRFRFLLLLNVGYTFVFLLLHYGYLKDLFTISELFLSLLFFGGVRLMISAVATRVRLKDISGMVHEQYTIADIRSLWLHIGIYDAFNRFVTWIDKFVVSIIFSASVSAVYFNATFDIPFLPLLLGAVGGAALMQMSGINKDAGNKGLVLVSNQTARLLSSIVFPLFFFLFVYRYELFTVILTSKYADSVPIFAVTVFIVPLRAYNFTTILQNRHKGRIINTGALLDAAIAFGLLYPLYKQFGLLGIALSFVISSYSQAVYYIYQTSKVLKVSVLSLIPFRNWVFKLIVFSFLFITSYFIFSHYFNDSIVLLLGGIIMVISLVMTLYLEYRSPAKKYGATIS